MNKIQKENRGMYILFSLYILLALYLYLYLSQGHYRWNSTDNVWGLAWVYTYINKGVIYNPVFDRGLNSPDVFGILRCYLYGGFLNIFGWTKGNSFLLSTIIFGMSVFVWSRILKKMDFSKKVRLSFAAIMVVIEPFFSMAHLARPDSLIFFLMSISFLLFINGNYLLSGFLGLMAFETHPMGLTVFFYSLAYVLGNREKFSDKKYLIKSLVFFMSGILFGCLYYYLLHGFPLDILIGKVQEGKNMGKDGAESIKNYLFEFYFKTDYKRHVPELLIFLLFMGINIKKKIYKENLFVLLLPIFIFLSSLIFRLANHSYGFYFYPGYILLIVYTASVLKWEKYVLIFFLCLLIPQYAFVGMKNRHFDFDSYVKFLDETVIQKDVVIYGHYDDWFAFYNREFYSFKNENITFSEDNFYYIKDESLATVKELFPDADVQFLDRIEGVGSQTSVYYITR